MKLSILADEDVNYNIIKKLRKHNFDVISVLEKYQSASDDDVLKISHDRKSILLTEDKDFGEWVFAHKAKVNGVVFLRYDPKDLTKITKSLVKVLSSHSTALYNKFVVITPKKIRVRDIV